MPWPQNTQYNEAIQNLRSAVSDDELRQGQPAVNAYGVPSPYSGNFADVYKVHCPATGNTWAVKCFTREVASLRDRYREISAQLQQARLSFTVDFHFVEPGIRIGGGWYPFLKMRWVEGISLNQFVGDSLAKPKTLGLLLKLWIKLGIKLRDAGVAHGDLQHGNVLLVPKGEGGKLAVKLIDYDGMYVPKLAGIASSEVGHPAYQHPQRLKQGTYNAHVDHFSQLAIYCAIRCLMAEQELWTKYDNGDNLLFRETDFQSPETSELLHHLWSLRDGDARALVGRLILATQMPLDRVPCLDRIISNGRTLPLRKDEEGQVGKLMDRGRRNVRAVPRTSAEAIVSSWWAERATDGPAAPTPSGKARTGPTIPRRGMPRPTSPTTVGSPASPGAPTAWWASPSRITPVSQPHSAGLPPPGTPMTTSQGPSGTSSAGVDLSTIQLTEELRQAVPEALVRENQVIPVGEDRDGITIAARNPNDLQLQQTLEFALGRRVRLVAAPGDAIAAAIDRLYVVERFCPRCGRRLLSKTTCLACAASGNSAGSTQEQASSAGSVSVPSDQDDRADLLTRLNESFTGISSLFLQILDAWEEAPVAFKLPIVIILIWAFFFLLFFLFPG